MTHGKILGDFYPDTTAIDKVKDKKYYEYPGETYIVDQISSTTYYVPENDGIIALCDNNYPKETITNRLLLSNSNLPDGEMQLTFQKYRYEKDSIRIGLKQFVSFCRQEGYTIYIGIEQLDSSTTIVDLFIFNKLKKWLHLLSLSCPTKDIADAGLTLKGNAWLFIPTSNVRELMGKELPKDFMNRLLRKTKK